MHTEDDILRELSETNWLGSGDGDPVLLLFMLIVFGYVIWLLMKKRGGKGHW